MTNHTIIKELRQKLDDNFDALIHIGADQNNISALLNSNNNNLEEQLLLGLDCIVYEWRDDDNIKYTCKKFYNPVDEPLISNNGYYMLFTKDFTNANNYEFYTEITDDNNFILKFKSEKAEFKSISKGDKKLFLQNNDEGENSFSFIAIDGDIENYRLDLANMAWRLFKTEKLYLRKPNNEYFDLNNTKTPQEETIDTLISYRDTFQKTIVDENFNNIVCTKYIINNNIN